MKHSNFTNFADSEILIEALKDSFTKLSLKKQLKNEVMFLVYIGSIFTSVLAMLSLLNVYHEDFFFVITIALVLWFTVLFANFAEALAEGRAKAQANTLKSLKKTIMANVLIDGENIKNGDQVKTRQVNSSELKKGDLILVKAGELIPCDGEIVFGLASVNESAITGESSPVIRGCGCDFDSVTGGTTVLSDFIIIKANAEPGAGFIDKMIAMVENSVRRKTPNEVALSILLIALTIVFTLVTVTILPFSRFAVISNSQGEVVSYTILIALLVCLIPTTIGGLLSAIGVAGMSRLLMSNVIAKSGRAVEAAGDVDILLLDKTGTITYGNREASSFYNAQGFSIEDLAIDATYASLPDDTPEGRSIVKLAKSMGINLTLPKEATFVPFSAQTKMSGVNIYGKQIRKGAPEAIAKYIEDQGGIISYTVRNKVKEIASKGSTPLLVANQGDVVGIIELKDIVKKGISEKFASLRTMGIKTVMITGDNPLTAASIAAEAGVDDFIAEATPESKLETIRKYQEEGHLVAMTGDGTNDAPALAQADVAVAMNSGTQSAKEAANMVDLDSSPTKLLDVVKIGKQMLITRGSLTTFSIANDMAKYFAIIPAAFASTYPELNVLNIMHLSTPHTALVSAVIFNALIIIFLIPLALRGVPYKALSAKALLVRNITIYGLGGIIAPFIGIKLIDMLISLFI